MVASQRIAIEDASAVGEVRRAAQTMASRLGFEAGDLNDVALVATEAATNLVKHAHSGEILLRPLAQPLRRNGPSQLGVEVLAIDRGPGLMNRDRAGDDGWSTAGSLGIGLGAIRRLSFRSDLFSQSGKGTAVVAQLFRAEDEEDSKAGTGRSEPLIGAVSVPKTGEEECGDSWVVEGPNSGEGRLRAFVVDGLGHGSEAARAANAAIQALGGCSEAAPEVALERVHLALRATRGAAAAIADVDFGRAIVTYCGIGNIAGVLVRDDEVRHLVSHNGILGHTATRFHVFQYPWSANSMLIMHSDGIGTRWNLAGYPGLLSHHPALAACVLYRDFARGSDDVTVLALREGKS